MKINRHLVEAYSYKHFLNYPPLKNMKYYRGVDLECYIEGNIYTRVNWNACTFIFSGKLDPNNNNKNKKNLPGQTKFRPFLFSCGSLNLRPNSYRL